MQDLDTSFVDDVGQGLIKVAQYGIIAICVFILLYIASMVFVERRYYRSLTDYVDQSRAQWAEDMDPHKDYAYLPTQAGSGIGRADIDRVLSTHTLLGFIASSNNPLLRSFLPWCMDKIPPLRRSPRARSDVTWFVAYITYLPALLLLTVAVLGLVSIEIQLAALKPTEANAQQQVNQGLSSFRSGILEKVNNATYEQSAAYSNGTNTVLLGMQSDLNDKMVSIPFRLQTRLALTVFCLVFLGGNDVAHLEYIDQRVLHRTHG